MAFVRGSEVCIKPPARGGCVVGKPIYWPPKRRLKCTLSPCPNYPLTDCCCCYDLPCKAHCFNATAFKRPSGRYARTVWYPGECPPCVTPCEATYLPQPPYPPVAAYTVNKPH